MKKRIILTLSHLAVLAGGGWLAGLNGQEDPVKVEVTPSERRTTNRSSQPSLAEFLEPKSEENSFARLRAELETVGNYREVVSELLQRLPKSYPQRGYTDEDLGQMPEELRLQVAEFEVRIRQWLSSDPEDCWKFLRLENHLGFLGRHSLFERVFADYALEEGQQDWVFDKVGGLEKVYLHQLEIHGPEEFLINAGRDFSRGEHNLKKVYGTIGFEHRDAVLQALVEGQGSWGKKRSALEGFLSNKSHDGQEVLAWIRGIGKDQSLPEEFKNESQTVMEKWLVDSPDLPVADRVALARDWGLSSHHSLETFAATGVKAALSQGRDLRYEFRHGRVGAAEVFSILEKQLELAGPEERSAARSQLYYELVSQDAARAHELLEPLPDFRRREVMVRALGTAFKYENPALAKDYYQALGKPLGEREEKNKQTNWGWQLYWSSSRHGDDLVDWMATMPLGVVRDESIKGLLSFGEKLPGHLRERLTTEFGRDE